MNKEKRKRFEHRKKHPLKRYAGLLYRSTLGMTAALYDMETQMYTGWKVAVGGDTGRLKTGQWYEVDSDRLEAFVVKPMSEKKWGAWT